MDYTAWEKGGSSPVFTRKESTSAAYGVTLDTKGLEHGSIDLAADGSSVELTKVDGRTCTFTMVRRRLRSPLCSPHPRLPARTAP